MNPWLALLIFFLSILDDVVVVFYMRRVVSGKKGTASILSGALTGLISLEVVIYVADPIYVIPNCIGSVVGTWAALLVEEKLPKTKSRDKKGKFKAQSVIKEVSIPEAEKIL
jgi:hypothetical protein